MTNRENFLKAMRRDSPGWAPFEFSLCPALAQEFERRVGKKDYAQYYGFPVREVPINLTRLQTDYSAYYGRLPENAEPLSWNSEWGLMGVRGSVAHFQHMLHPMARFSTVEEIECFPLPDFAAPYRWAGVAGRVREVQAQGLAALAPMQMTLFEISWYLRGMEAFMTDMLEDNGMALALLDRITAIRVAMAAEYARAGYDVLMLGDDVATQLDMMISPALWRSLFKPRLASVIGSAKAQRKDILIFYHGDGNMRKIIPDLMEIGVDILNPVQPECMDPGELKRLYGGKLSFWGTLGTQSTLPFGTPEEVAETCHSRIEIVGAGGGLLLSPSHVLEPEVPFENIEAMVSAARRYGRY
jgi:uroporphyrinogen decarboxylase